MHESNIKTPTKIWRPEEVTDPLLDEAVTQAVYEMNQENPGELIDSLQKNKEVSENGVAFSVLKGENPAKYSDTEALVLFNPFANTISPNTLVKAEFIRRVAEKLEIHDDEGKLKPVVMLASPGIGGSSSKLSLGKEERQRIKKGELGIVASEMLQTVSEKDLGRVSLFGFSQGADMALAAANRVSEHNLDAQELSIGDPAGTEDRGLIKIMSDFGKATDLKPSIESTGLDAQKAAIGNTVAQIKDFSRFGAASLMRTNLVLARGMGNDTFLREAQELLDQGEIEKMVVAYGGDSAIAKPESIEPALDQLHREDEEGVLTSIKVEEANHTWGDNLRLLAKLYMRALI